MAPAGCVEHNAESGEVMSTQQWGASPSQLRDLSDSLHGQAAQLTGTAKGAQTLVAALSWRGPVADHFQLAWQSQLQVQLLAVSDRLRRVAEDLAENAQQQEDASQVGLSADRGFMTDIADRYGHPRTLLNGQVAVAGDLLGEGVLATLKSAAHALGGADAVALFMADVAEHPELTDPVEAGLHGLVEVGLIMAAEHGISQASMWLGTALGGLLAGLGAFAGRVVGWAVGELAAIAFQKLDGHLDITESGADLALETFRYFRDNPRDVLAQIPGIGMAIGHGLLLWDTASELLPSPS
ncbi:MAG: hypothetical protein K0U64_05335 [Actinomycetia bacterium]|nr:hypothetical protein [Actinomycetes bacterium]